MAESDSRIKSIFDPDIIPVKVNVGCATGYKELVIIVVNICIPPSDDVSFGRIARRVPAVWEQVAKDKDPLINTSEPEKLPVILDNIIVPVVPRFSSDVIIALASVMEPVITILDVNARDCAVYFNAG